jgi:hypothetical protein
MIVAELKAREESTRALEFSVLVDIIVVVMSGGQRVVGLVPRDPMIASYLSHSIPILSL